MTAELKHINDVVPYYCYYIKISEVNEVDNFLTFKDIEWEDKKIL